MKARAAMAMERIRLDALKTGILLSLLFLLFVVIGWGLNPAKDCSPTATVTTSIGSLEKPVSGLEFLTMAPMQSAVTPSPHGSYAKAKVSNSSLTRADGPLSVMSQALFRAAFRAARLGHHR